MPLQSREGLAVFQCCRSSEVLNLNLISLSKFNLPLIGTFTWPTPPGPDRATTCRRRDHTHNFLTTQGHGGLPGWVISSMPGPPPKTAQTWKTIHTRHTLFIPTSRIWNGDNGGQMIFGDLGGLKFPDICLAGEKKPRKNLTQETCPDRGSNPARCVTSAHVIAWATAVD